MIVKTHKSSNERIVVSVCDTELLGKKFEEKNIQIDLDSDFYKGEEATEEEIISLFRKAFTVNLVGKQSVDIGIKAGIVNKDKVIKVEGVPYAMAVL